MVLTVQKMTLQRTTRSTPQFTLETLHQRLPKLTFIGSFTPLVLGRLRKFAFNVIRALVLLGTVVTRKLLLLSRYLTVESLVESQLSVHGEASLHHLEWSPNLYRLLPLSPFRRCRLPTYCHTSGHWRLVRWESAKR